MSEFARDVTDAKFNEVVIGGSHTQLVVVDFWAPWCGPCRVLKPVLESLATEFDGRFLLAKINADENPGACRDYGVRGIPSVKAFWQGEVVDEFTGALSEAYVRDFISRNLPSPAAELVREAQDRRRQGNLDAALVCADKALSVDPGSDVAKVERAEILFAQGKIQEASDIVDSLRGEILDYEHTHRLKARLDLARQVLSLSPREELMQQVQVDTENITALFGLALYDAAASEYEGAMERLLKVMKVQPRFGDGAARKAMLAIFEILGHDAPLVALYRRRLASVLN